MGGVKMPSIFKALASITVWVLFIFGFLALLAAFIRIIGVGTGVSEPPELGLMTAYFGYGVSSLFLSVVTMKLRKMLE
jgi:hypothetical protein